MPKAAAHDHLPQERVIPDRIDEVAAENFWVKTNPRPLRGPADAREILEGAW